MIKLDCCPIPSKRYEASSNINNAKYRLPPMVLEIKSRRIKCRFVFKYNDVSHITITSVSSPS